jgi:hypothetical protein
MQRDAGASVLRVLEENVLGAMRWGDRDRGVQLFGMCAPARRLGLAIGFRLAVIGERHQHAGSSREDGHSRSHRR